MENKYYLAVETKPKNYFPINLLDLNISHNFTTTKLEELDAFTLKFTKNEIMDSIKESNLLDINVTMPLIIIYNEKNVVRKALALTKDMKFDMWENIKKNYKDKNYINKLYNFLNNKTDNNISSEIKNTNDINTLFNLISSLPYPVQRKLYFYLYEK